MMKNLLFIFLCVPYVILSQNTVGTISITEDAFEGYTLFTSNTKTFLINNCGEVVNEWNSALLPGNAVYLLPNGNLLRAGKSDNSTSALNLGGIGGIIELYDWDDNLLWSYTYSTDSFRQHHDVYPLPNGNILVLAITPMTNGEAIQAGRNPAMLSQNELYNEQIIEIEPVGTDNANIVWEWNVKDHLIQDFDNTKDNFGVVADNPQRLDINFLNGLDGARNWLHINSMQYNAERDQIILSSRHLSEIYIIDHSTTTAEAATGSGGTYGRGGDFLYRWGNPEAYDQGTSADRVLFGQHYPHFIESGLPNEDKIILFNNGIERNPSFSQVDIMTPPESSLGVYDYVANSAYGPLTPDYTYKDLSTDPSEFYTAILSSAQQLPNGNILVCEGFDGYVFELDSNDNKVWEYINPMNNSDGSVASQFGSPVNPRLFRAIKFAPDYPAFSGRDLTPGSPIEGNPDLTPCNELSISEFDQVSTTIYPNPTKDVIHVESNSAIDSVEVYNILGRKVLVTQSSKVDLSEQPSGVYLIKIYAGQNSLSKKVIKQ
ncbi:aryl-sulfate sulfotransferase [Winogradskyella sp.]|uniref:aryl-sulfate sulfotransferase n=1 Tax=Winogradskyella sp. TaxID=1883156 RepID=UPI003BA965BF